MCFHLSFHVERAKKCIIPSRTTLATSLLSSASAHELKYSSDIHLACNTRLSLIWRSIRSPTTTERTLCAVDRIQRPKAAGGAASVVAHVNGIKHLSLAHLRRDRRDCSQHLKRREKRMRRSADEGLNSHQTEKEQKKQRRGERESTNTRKRARDGERERER